MPFSLGNNNITKMYLGTNEVQKIYLGNTQVYGRQWTPADITTLAWFDAADADTITLNGSNVTQWDDKSGNGYNLSQATAASQALYAATGYNGLPTLTFDGGNDNYINNDVALAIGADDFMMFLVCRTSTQEGKYMLATVASESRVYLTMSSNIMTLTWGSEPVEQSFNVGPGVDHLLAWSRTSGTVQTFTDGTVQATGTATFPNPLNSFALHAFANGAANADGSTCELVITPALSTSDRQKMEGYLAHKWGLTSNLPADHPYKSSRPII